MARILAPHQYSKVIEAAAQIETLRKIDNNLPEWFQTRMDSHLEYLIEEFRRAEIRSALREIFPNEERSDEYLDSEMLPVNEVDRTEELKEVLITLTQTDDDLPSEGK